MEYLWLKTILKVLATKIASLESTIDYYESKVKELEGKLEGKHE